MNGLKQYVLPIINIKPRSVLSGLPWIIIKKDRATILLSKFLRLLHAFNDLLSSITMVDIKVNNSYLFYLLSISAHNIRGSDCNIVDVAKAIGLFLVALVVFESFSEDAGVMAWRSNSAEGVFEILGNDLVTCFNDCSTGEKGCLPSFRGNT
jgi:hypothetical protein